MADHGSKLAGTMPSLGLGFRVREMHKEIYIKRLLCCLCGRSWVKNGGYDAVIRVSAAKHGVSVAKN